MDWRLKQKIENAVEAAITQMEASAKGEKCIVCGDDRTYFPGVIHLFQKEGGLVEAAIKTKEDFAGADGWINLVEAYNATEGPKVLLCKRCAIRKGTIPDPDACRACEEEVGGIGRCEKHNPLPKVESAPVAKSEEQF